jgi:hypothetical protein
MTKQGITQMERLEDNYRSIFDVITDGIPTAEEHYYHGLIARAVFGCLFGTNYCEEELIDMSRQLRQFAGGAT